MANFLKSLFVKGVEIDPAGATSDQVLKYNGTKFVPGTASTVGSIDDLTDVIITSPLEYESLVYNGTNWVNQYASTATYVRNAEATTLTTGTVVYLFGATGDHATVKRADNDSDTTSSKTVGLVASPIAASENGPVVTRGYVDGINLSTGYASGDILWLGEDGAFTKVKPTAPEHLVFIGVVVRATNNGIVYVATQNGYELDELHNVSVSSPTAGQVLTYNGSLWTAASASGGGSASITVSDTPPVSPTAGALWFESDSGLTFIYYDSSWVEIGAGASYDPITRIVQAKGDLILGTASQTVDRLSVGTDSQRLIANSSASTGVSWASDSTNTVIDAKGDLLVGATNNVVAKLPVGTDNQMLVANSSATNGLAWVDQPTGFRNVLINGDMRIAQRGTSATSLTSSSYPTCDRWEFNLSSAGTWTATQSTDAPTGFSNSLKVQCTTANASLATTNNARIWQKIEGFNVQQFAKGTADAKPLVLTFWVKSFQTGTFICTLDDLTNTRKISASYTINASATWEKKTLSFAGDTTGALANSSSATLMPTWWIAAGPSWQGSALSTSWSAGATLSNYADGQTNVASSTNNYFQITGVQLEANTVATPFEHRPYGTELSLCQRYYTLVASGNGVFVGNAAMQSTTAFESVVPLPVPMRTAPALVATTGTDYYGIYVLNVERRGPSLANASNSPLNLRLYGTLTTSTTVGSAAGFYTTNASASIAASAEL